MTKRRACGTVAGRVRASGASVGHRGAWIAATAVAGGLPGVTQDRDFLALDGLEVVPV